MKNIKCFLGWHSWTWTLEKVNEFITEPLTDNIPDRAVCEYCQKEYVFNTR